MREVRCGREQWTEPVVHGDHTLTVLDVLYHVHDRSFGERWIVISDGSRWEVVGRATDLFGVEPDDFVGLQGRELRGETEPTIVLEGITRTRETTECVHRTAEHRSLVVCERRAGAYRCLREPIGGRETIEIGGAAHPRSSQYDYGVARRCGPTLADRGLDAEQDRREEIEPRRRVSLARAGVLQIEGQEVPLDPRLAPECPVF